MRYLVARQAERLLADQLTDLHGRQQICPLLLREVARPLRQQAHELFAQRRHAVAGLGADRMQRVEVTELRRRLHLRDDVAGLQAVDLVHGDHDRNAELEDAPRDEAVTGPDPLACRNDEQDRFDILEGGIHRPLHVLRQRVERPLKSRQVGEHELVAIAVCDSQDPSTRRLRLVRDDRDLAAAQRVDERRLADVRPPGDGDESRPHCPAGRSQVSGSNSAAA